MIDLPPVPILVKNELATILNHHNISPSQYRPAYKDESIGLDLYYTGPTILVPPGIRDYQLDWAFGGSDTDEEIIKTQFNKVFKNLLPTGLLISVPPGWVALIKERGSIIKTCLSLRAGVIDPGYTGEVFVNCVNLSAHPWEINHGSKLPFQLVVVQANTNFQPVTEEEFLSLTEYSTRKEGMIGSSDQRKE